MNGYTCMLIEWRTDIQSPVYLKTRLNLHFKRSTKSSLASIVFVQLHDFLSISSLADKIKVDRHLRFLDTGIYARRIRLISVQLKTKLNVCTCKNLVIR